MTDDSAWKMLFAIWDKFGPIGLTIIALVVTGWVVAWFLRKDVLVLLSDHRKDLAEHRQDRDQWLEDARQDQKEMRDIVGCNTKVMGKLHMIIDERIPKR